MVEAGGYIGPEVEKGHDRVGSVLCRIMVVHVGCGMGEVDLFAWHEGFLVRRLTGWMTQLIRLVECSCQS